jgi:hypothetical protein
MNKCLRCSVVHAPVIMYSVKIQNVGCCVQSLCGNYYVGLYTWLRYCHKFQFVDTSILYIENLIWADLHVYVYTICLVEYSK